MAAGSRITSHNKKLTDEAVTLQDLEDLRKINITKEEKQKTSDENPDKDKSK